MRKIVLTVLLAAASGVASADWSRVGGNEAMTSYADPATIRKAGDVVKMWIMVDYRAPQDAAQIDATAKGKRYLSVTVQSEYDCREDRSRAVFVVLRAGPMGKGDAVYSSNGISSDWLPVVPGTNGERDWKFACTKR